MRYRRLTVCLMLATFSGRRRNPRRVVVFDCRCHIIIFCCSLLIIWAIFPSLYFSVRNEAFLSPTNSTSSPTGKEGRGDTQGTGGWDWQVGPHSGVGWLTFVCPAILILVRRSISIPSFLWTHRARVWLSECWEIERPVCLPRKFSISFLPDYDDVCVLPTFVLSVK